MNAERSRETRYGEMTGRVVNREASVSDYCVASSTLFDTREMKKKIKIMEFLRLSMTIPYTSEG